MSGAASRAGMGLRRRLGRPAGALAVLLVGIAAAGFAPAGADRPAAARTSRLVVRFEPGHDSISRQRALARNGLALLDTIPGTDYVLARAEAGATTADVEADPSVAAAHPPAVAHALGRVRSAPTPDDPLFKNQWHLRSVGVPRAWDVSTGEGVVVAVLDTGVAYEDFGPFKKAPDLAGTKFVPGWDFVEGDDHPNDLPIGGKGSHGTAMAGTIAQTTNNGIGGAGVAPGATIMPVRVLAANEQGTTFNIAKGLRFAADHGANVANLSLGTRENAPELADAVAYAIGKGVTVIASSGDDGTEALTYPAAYPDVLAVGATGYGNARTEYSNYGAGLDLVAPGGDLEDDGNEDGLDDGVVQQALYELSTSFCFCFRQGTSSAAAHVSGVAALVLASGPARTPAQVADILVSTAADLGPKGRDDQYGAGLVQATRALGMPRLAGETPPTVHDHSTHDHDHGTEEGQEEAAATGRDNDRDRDRGSQLAARSRGDDGSSDSGLVAWLRRQRVWLAMAAGLVIFTYLVPLLRRRRSGRET